MLSKSLFSLRFLSSATVPQFFPEERGARHDPFLLGRSASPFPSGFPFLSYRAVMTLLSFFPLDETVRCTFYRGKGVFLSPPPFPPVPSCSGASFPSFFGRDSNGSFFFFFVAPFNPAPSTKFLGNVSLGGEPFLLTLCGVTRKVLLPPPYAVRIITFSSQAAGNKLSPFFWSPPPSKGPLSPARDGGRIPPFSRPLVERIQILLYSPVAPPFRKNIRRRFSSHGEHEDLFFPFRGTAETFFPLRPRIPSPFSLPGQDFFFIVELGNVFPFPRNLSSPDDFAGFLLLLSG